MSLPAKGESLLELEASLLQLGTYLLAMEDWLAFGLLPVRL